MAMFNRLIRTGRLRIHRWYSHRTKDKLVLGIETSCDDTGVAVVDQTGRVLGQSLYSQIRTHVAHGGIVPPVARDLHKANVDQAIEDALLESRTDPNDLDAVAVSVEPGLVSCLRVGLDKAIQLCREWNKPLIPIHHMKAHALTVRLEKKVDFPFLALLASGGHCLLTVAISVDDFLLLGRSLDDAPGECFDKIARRLRLKEIVGYEALSGGQAIEKLAKEGGDPKKHAVYNTMTRRTDCNFSFAGMKTNFNYLIAGEERKRNPTEGILPNVHDICASVQYSVAHHLCRRLQRAIVFCDMKGLLPSEGRTLVLSGGVGSNDFIRRALVSVCRQYDLELVCPPAELCRDNGVMIAWNGMEKLLIDSGLVYDGFDDLDVRGRSPLGPNLTEEIERTHIVKLQKIKLI